eukprot:1058217-Rhodomonas_salina.1
MGQRSVKGVRGGGEARHAEEDAIGLELEPAGGPVAAQGIPAHEERGATHGRARRRGRSVGEGGFR